MYRLLVVGLAVVLDGLIQRRTRGAADRQVDDRAQRLVEVSSTKAAPEAITLTILQVKTRSTRQFQLSWHGARGDLIDVYRNGAIVAVVPNTGTYVDQPAVKGNSAFEYRVCETQSVACSATRVVLDD